MKLTELQMEVLGNLAHHTKMWPKIWAKPQDLGGSNGSSHGKCIYQLSERGLCERKSYTPGMRRVHAYRINEAGLKALEANKEKA